MTTEAHVSLTGTEDPRWHVSPGLHLVASGWALVNMFPDHTKFLPVSVPLPLQFRLSGIISPHLLPSSNITFLDHPV